MRRPGADDRKRKGLDMADADAMIDGFCGISQRRGLKPTVSIKTVGGKTNFWPKPQKPESEVIFHTFDPITTTNTLHSLLSGLFDLYFSTLLSPTLKFLR